MFDETKTTRNCVQLQNKKDFTLEHLQEFGIFYSQNMEFANSQISIGRKKEVISNSLL